MEIGLAIGFGVCNRKSWLNTAAVLEWVVALVYTFYVWSFAIDFIPAIRTKTGFESKDTEVGMVMAMEGESRGRGWSGTGEEQRGYVNAGHVGWNGNESYKPAEPVVPSRNF